MKAIKESRDQFLNFFGMYGAGKLSYDEMKKDSAKDLEANEYGFKCGNESCGKRCEKFLDPYPISKQLLKDKGYLE